MRERSDPKFSRPKAKISYRLGWLDWAFQTVKNLLMQSQLQDFLSMVHSLSLLAPSLQYNHTFLIRFMQEPQDFFFVCLNRHLPPSFIRSRRALPLFWFHYILMQGQISNPLLLVGISCFLYC